MGELTEGIIIMLCIASILLAYFSWRFVEKPFRDKNKTSRKMIFGLFISGLILFQFIGFFSYKTYLANGPIVGSLGIFDQIPKAKEASDKNVRSFYERLDGEFKKNNYVAGDRFTIADITLVSAIDFASDMVNLEPQKALKNLHRWHKEVSSRPSMLVE